MSELLTFRRFVELESRVRRIERHLHLTPEPAAGESATALPATPIATIAQSGPPAIPVAEEVLDVRSAAAEVSPAHVAVPPPLPVIAPAVPVGAIDAMTDDSAPARVLPYNTPAVAVQRKDTHTSFEQWIGLNWTGWVGAIVLVIGAALGIKYAYDSGWLAGLPKEVRLGLCFAGGLGLLGVGEWIDRKINRISAACVLGAGVATLFVVSYAGFGYFELYAQSTAFVLMAISTFIGAGVAMRKNLVSIAALALLGGNLAPIILQTHEPRYAALLGYVLVLQIIALALTAFGRGGKWWIMRGFAIVMPAFWVAAVYYLMLNNQFFRNVGFSTIYYPPGSVRPPQAPIDMWLPICFSIAFAVLSQIELIVSTGKPGRIVAGLAAPCCILVASLLTLSLVFGLQSNGRNAQGIAVLAMAGACGAMAAVLWSGRGELAMSYRILSALLVLVSVPIMLDGRAVVLTWGGLTLAYAIIGRQVASKYARWFAAAAWAAAVLYLGQWIANDPTAQELFAVDLPQYLCLAAFLTAVGHALAWIVTREDRSPRDRGATGYDPAKVTHEETDAKSGVATEVVAHSSAKVDAATAARLHAVFGDDRFTAAVAGAFAQPDAAVRSLGQVVDFVAGAMLVAALMNALPAWYATAAIAGYAWLLLILSRVAGRSAWAGLSAGAILFALAKWASVDMLGQRIAPTFQANQYLPVVNPIMGVGTLLAGSVVGMYALQRKTFDEWAGGRRMHSAALAVAAIVLVVMTFGLSMEVDRMVAQVRAGGGSEWPSVQLELMGFSTLWTAALAIHAGLVMKLSEGDRARRSGLAVGSGLMAVVAFKFVLLDTLGWWLLEGAAAVTPIANLQALTGVLVAGGLALFWWLRDREGQSWRFGGAMMLAILLLGGTVEIDRAFEQTASASSLFADPRLAKQVAISIYWALFAVASVIGGFRFRIAGLRYFGLALLAVALGKVVIIDLREIGRGYRILSFLGLGGLMLATSVVYGKLSPKLLGEEK